MQIEITTQTHDSSTTDLMAMFDVAASLLRAITGALSSAYNIHAAWYDYQVSVTESATNSNMSVDCTIQSLGLVPKIA